MKPLALIALLVLAGCGTAHPHPAGASHEVVALMLIAREIHDVFWALLILALIGCFSK